jgi:hypothetical protein
VSGLGDKIRVERLDTGRLARIEASVLAARELPGEGIRPRAQWLRFAAPVAAACALVLVAGALGYWLRGSGGAGPVATGSPPVPAITTGRGERATVAIGDAVVSISPSTQVSFRSRPDGQIDLDLQRGKVDCDVNPRPGRPLFAVHAADVDVAVVGTAFSVARSGAEVTVRVSRGKVSVTRAGEQVYVAAGENWPADTRVALADPDPGSGSVSDPDPGSVSDPDPDPDPDPGSVSDPDPDPDPDPGSGSVSDPGAEHRSGKHADKTTKPGITLPASLPALDPCASSPDPIAACTSKGMRPGPENAPALYTAIHLEVAAGRLAAARTHASLYDKRFQRRRPTEADAVRALRRVAEGGE